ncbi:DUF488 domain-containing protein [Thermofilum pendens]|uniref:DUF488 domain-containing protein n=1 Tax=Thermofilum pendens (strain DSM 2475 / Hrk 5) TaxID=368408 RepID=A1S077_THEPD|nr:DUF488 family protein [Thermofilum pendens]ABL78857.1 protein of unknown function DUF1130 [Thermofilum pendens Hrk 5]
MGEVYTLGYGGLSPERFAEKVFSLGVRVVVDVRRYPRSKVEFFSGDKLSAWLAEAGVGYEWMGELGALGMARRRGELGEAPCTDSPTFRVYVAYLVSDPGALAALSRIGEMASRGLRPLLLCRERKPEHCHRQFVADALVARGFRVVHVVGDELVPHAGSPCYGYVAERLEKL